MSDALPPTGSPSDTGNRPLRKFRDVESSMVPTTENYTGPRWEPGNLSRHYQKRLREDAACTVLGGSRQPPMSQDDYERETYATVDGARMKYEAEHFSYEKQPQGDWEDRRRYYVDNRLVLVVADLAGKDVVTCYHKHFPEDNGCNGAGDPSESRDRRQKFRDRIRRELQGNLIRNLNWIPTW
jgi:hypothetical protein